MKALAMIRAWAEDRNLIRGSGPQPQTVKLVEEIGELADGIINSHSITIKDSIGDGMVVLTILAEQLGTKIETCIVQHIHSADESFYQGLSTHMLMLHMVKSMGDIADGVSKGKRDLTEKGIGRMVALLAVLATEFGTSLEDCTNDAYDEIKDRKGRMVGGVFIKEADL